MTTYKFCAIIPVVDYYGEDIFEQHLYIEKSENNLSFEDVERAVEMKISEAKKGFEEDDQRYKYEWNICLKNWEVAKTSLEKAEEKICLRGSLVETNTFTYVRVKKEYKNVSITFKRIDFLNL
jgi:hypothetical protein